MRGVWELIVACKGSVVVAWRRGRVRVVLGSLLVVAAMVGAVGGLWLVAGEIAGDRAGDDAAAPIDDRATPDRRDADGGAAGPRGTVPAVRRQLPGSGGRGSAESAGAWSASARDRAPGSRAGPDSEGSVAVRPSGGIGAGGSSVLTSATTTPSPNRGGSPSPSTPATPAPAPSVPPGGSTTTTTGTKAPPAGDSGAGDAGALGGLLGGVLEVLRVG